LRCLLLLLASLLVGPGLTAQAPSPTPGFLILVDPATHAAIAPSLEAYRDAIRADGLDASILSRAWQRPDELRELLRKQHEMGLEGAVLVGDLPVPMLRDAQHMSSAFKMDQERYPWRRSSIPSDRYYEDFDLRFEFLRQDAKEPRLFYYSLRADSAQQLRKEIYTARMPLPAEGAAGLARLGGYLERVAARKRGEREIRRMLLVAGHGYNSESIAAWTGEQIALREMLPRLYRPGSWLGAWWHDEDPRLENTLLRELQRAPLQIAMFHAHGAPTTQYLIGNPKTPNTATKIAEVKRYLRERLRRAKERGKSVEAEQLKLMQQLELPLSWFEGAFDEKQMAADATLLARQDLQSEELAGVAPRADFVIFDQCYNGRFIEPGYVAGEYVFGSGEVVVAMANTVNVLQDIWPSQDLWLLDQGERVGALHKQRHYLESHLIGDPTWRFAALPEAERVPLRWVQRLREMRARLARRDFTQLLGALEHPYELVRRKASFVLGGRRYRLLRPPAAREDALRPVEACAVQREERARQTAAAGRAAGLEGAA
jgi:hypothetical protein